MRGPGPLGGTVEPKNKQIYDNRLQEFQWNTLVRSRQYEYCNYTGMIGQVLIVTSNP